MESVLITLFSFSVSAVVLSLSCSSVFRWNMLALPEHQRRVNQRRRQFQIFAVIAAASPRSQLPALNGDDAGTSGRSADARAGEREERRKKTVLVRKTSEIQMHAHAQVESGEKQALT